MITLIVRKGVLIVVDDSASVIGVLLEFHLSFTSWGHGCSVDPTGETQCHDRLIHESALHSHVQWH